MLFKLFASAIGISLVLFAQQSLSTRSGPADLRRSGIKCLSGETAVDEQGKGTVTVAVLLDENVYTQITSDSYDYVKIKKHAGLKTISRFELLSTPTVVQIAPGIEDKNYSGLIRFRADIELTPEELSGRDVLFGVVSLPLYDETTGVVVTRRFASFPLE